MRRYLFQKANWLLKNRDLKIISETPHSLRVKVGEYEVVVKYRNHNLLLLCTCTSEIKQSRLCSHKIAALSYLAWKKSK